MTLSEIGVVRCAVAERTAMPALGAAGAAVEVHEAYEAALLHLDKHTHVWILAWLDKTGREALRVTPRGVRDQGEAGKHGVFAVRSPTRPNPIGLTAARIVRIDGRRIELDRLDFVDGTAVIDIKPYFATRDLIYSARSRQVGRAATVEAISESLLMQAELFLGTVTPEAARAAAILAEFRAGPLAFSDPPAWRIEVPATCPEWIDAMQAMTRVRFGDGSLRLTEGDRLRIEAGGASVEYEIR
jgi:tRNA-Thr(GGU) m(6)t(6)A37 methyltransferase TsaA